MSYQLLKKIELVAAKGHRCIWCPEPINKESVYIRESSVFNGDFQNHHWHPECWKASQDYFSDSGENEFSAHENKRGNPFEHA